MLFLFLISLSSNATILFEDNFDSDDDWTVTQPSSQDAYCLSSCNIGDGDWDHYLNGYCWADNELSGEPGNNLLYIDQYAGYPDETNTCHGGSGKCLTYWQESFASWNNWESDGDLGIDLGEEKADIYMRWFVRFKNGFELGAEYSQFKMWHVQHYDPTSYELQFVSGSGSAPTYGVTINGATSGATGEVNGLVLGSGSWGSNATGALSLINITGTFQNGETLRVSSTGFATASGTTHLSTSPWRYFAYSAANRPLSSGGLLIGAGSNSISFYAGIGCQYQGGSYCNGDIIWPISSVTVARAEGGLFDGDWHSIEYHFHRNSEIGTDDAYIEVWLDGNKLTHLDGYPDHDLKMNDTGSLELRGFRYASIGGNSNNKWDTSCSNAADCEQWYAMDDIVVADEYIGPDYDIGIDETAPIIGVSSISGVTFQ